MTKKNVDVEKLKKQLIAFGKKKGLITYDDLRALLPPDLINPPKGCVFHPRCSLAVESCSQAVPEFRELRPGHWVACSEV